MADYAHPSIQGAFLMLSAELHLRAYLIVFNDSRADVSLHAYNFDQTHQSPVINLKQTPTTWQSIYKEGRLLIQNPRV